MLAWQLTFIREPNGFFSPLREVAMRSDGVTSRRLLSSLFRQIDQDDIGILPQAVEDNPLTVRRNVECHGGLKARQPDELAFLVRGQIEQPEAPRPNGNRTLQVHQPLPVEKARGTATLGACLN